MTYAHLLVTFFWGGGIILGCVAAVFHFKKQAQKSHAIGKLGAAMILVGTIIFRHFFVK